MTAYLGPVPSYPFLKGHGTENDFVLLPDHDGSVHGELPAARVALLCDRRAGIGGDGVLRVIRTAVADPSQADQAEWFMDYRNADGSLSEMCGNGIRLFARHLVDEGLADPRGPIPIATRDGVKLILVDNIYDPALAKRVARESGAHVVIVPNQVRGEKRVDDYPALIDHALTAAVAGVDAARAKRP